MGKVIASVAKVKDGEVKAIAITHLIPFSGHGFTLYDHIVGNEAVRER